MKKSLKYFLVGIGTLAIACGSSFVSYNQGFEGGNKVGNEEGYRLGHKDGISEGRKGYQRTYTGGKIAVEGYDERGYDYNCKTARFFLRPGSGWVTSGLLKSGIGYSYNEIANHPSIGELWAFRMKAESEATCIAAGYRPHS